jgi:uncharacterized membrane protein
MKSNLEPSTRAAVLVALILTGAIFGFFYAWVSSTMWGLDAADPRVAIEAMQEMNASVRNAVFFPAFFLTPFALTAAGALLRRDGARRTSTLFILAGGVYLVGGLLLTATVNVPMNRTLALVDIPDSIEAAGRIWTDYSERWQVWNLVRTFASGVALLLVGVGLTMLRDCPEIDTPSA